jgi:glycine cleavage system aminomethyltransferase T
VIALASVDAARSDVGTRVEFEWTVEARRGRVPATVVELPFFNPERKTATLPSSS